MAFCKSSLGVAAITAAASVIINSVASKGRATIATSRTVRGIMFVLLLLSVTRENRGHKAKDRDRTLRDCYGWMPAVSYFGGCEGAGSREKSAKRPRLPRQIRAGGGADHLGAAGAAD